MWRLQRFIIPLRGAGRLGDDSKIVPHATIMANQKKNAYRQLAKKQRRSESAKEGSNEEILSEDVKSLLSVQSINDENGKDHKDSYAPPERFSEIEVTISELSSTGDGLGLSSNSDHVYVVPFTAPGDVVQARVVNHFVKEKYTTTDFIKVIKPSPARDDSRIRCKYFAKCSGCQLQMLSYDYQLAHKKTIIERAYKNFSSLLPELIPGIGDTICSPLQYGYRTKLTPHFDGPPGCHRRASKQDGAERPRFTEAPPIGFMLKGTRKTMDIEECPIGTQVLNLGMRRERQRVVTELSSFKRGATILLRESTKRIPVDPEVQRRAGTSERDPEYTGNDAEEKNDGGFPKHSLTAVDLTLATVSTSHPTYRERKTCITDSNATSIEYIDSFVLANKAGAFFQNNNSILSRFTAYIRDNVLPVPPASGKQPIKYLIDAYCGSGLFTVTLSSLFSSSMGIDIAGASIVSAQENAKANNINNATFIAADASSLFDKVKFPADETAVIIDPPRKGCDDSFLQQLLRFGPKRVVYVSCNVHTQARDVGILVEGKNGCRYDLETLQGFDFFPQTGHVEGVAVLNRVGEVTSKEDNPVTETRYAIKDGTEQEEKIEKSDV